MIETESKVSPGLAPSAQPNRRPGYRDSEASPVRVLVVERA